MRKLSKFEDVVEVFGGPASLARMTDNKTSAVWNWKMKRGRFPAKFYLSMNLTLREQGCWAPPDLWGQVKLIDAKLHKAQQSEQQAAA